MPKGIGPRVLAALGAHLDPKVLAQLELRETKKQARSAAFEAGRDLSAELETMRAAGCYEDVDTALKAWKDAHPEVDRFHAKDREDYVQRGQAALDEALERAQRERQVGA